MRDLGRESLLLLVGEVMFPLPVELSRNGVKRAFPRGEIGRHLKFRKILKK